MADRSPEHGGENPVGSTKRQPPSPPARHAAPRRAPLRDAWRRCRGAAAAGGRQTARRQPSRASWNWLTGATIAVALASAWVSAEAQPLDTRVVASGFSQPVFATAAPGVGLAVVEKGGTIRLAQGGTNLDWLSLPVATAGEQGLLGLAFDPGWADPASAGFRRFFVDYSDAASGDTVVASFRADAAGTRVDLGSRQEVLRIDQPAFTNHKAGWIGFKPGDANHLYIATGDGGGANDPLNAAQDRSSLLGKMLRVDVNRDDFAADPARNYAIPADNPFAGVAGARGEIFAYGLRNPWRNGFDRETGDLWIADVGQSQREEVDVIAAGSPGGQNFGWRVREGDIATPGIADPTPPDLTEPVLVYDHSDGQAITGGYVVRDTASPLYGRYVFGDFVSGRVWSVAADGGPVSFADAVELTDWIHGGAAGPLDGIVSFGEGANGELLIVDFGGRIVQVVPEPATLALWAAGLALVAARTRRRKAAAG